MPLPAREILPDARPTNWVDRFAPPLLRPYLKLARADRPIGTWLLMWPCMWGTALGAAAIGAPFPNLWHMFLFFAGSIVMRAAGCAYNDIIDRDFDRRVARTALRPVASGRISVPRAWAFLVTLSLIGLIILLQFNPFTIFLGLSSLILVAAYPFMKRFTYWPQAWLGLTFNWGALMGWSAATGGLALAPVALYVAGVFWTLGYDTIYAHQDKEDDALIGVKSTALKLGAATRPWLAFFYGAALGMFVVAGALTGLSWPFYLWIAGAGAHFAWQAATLNTDDPEQCLATFKSNQHVGVIVFIAFAAGAMFKAL